MSKTHLSSRKKVKSKSTGSVVEELSTPSVFAGEKKGSIEIAIVHLEIQEKEVDVGITGELRVNFGSQIIGSIGNLHIPSFGGRIALDYCCYLEIPEIESVIMDTIISTPLFFTLLANTDRQVSGKKAGPSVDREKTVKETGQFDKRFPEHGQILGQGNLDFLSLVLNKNGKIEETVCLELPGHTDTLFFRRSSSENPLLLVRLTDIGNSFAKVPLNNIMWVTVESIFNPSAPHLFDDCEYTAVFPIPRQEVDIEPDLSLSSHSHDVKGKTKLDSAYKMNVKPAQKLLENTINSKSKLHHNIGDRSNWNVKHARKLDTKETEEISSDLGEGSSIDVCTDKYPRSNNPPDQSRDYHEYTSSYESSSEDNTSSSCIILKDKSVENDDTGGRLVLDATKSKKKSNNQSNRRSASPDHLASRLLDYKLLEFPMGIWKEDRELDLRKKWTTLATISGGPSKQKARVPYNSSGLFSKFKVNIEKKMTAEQEPKIIWNMIRPFWLDQQEEQNIIRRIYKYGVWPLEIVVSGKSGKPDRKNTESSSQVNEKRKVDARSFITWLDLSTLLFPGNDTIRVSGQLQMFSKEESERLWGIHSMFFAHSDDALSKNANSPDTSSTISKKKGKSVTMKDSSKRHKDKIVNPLIDSDDTATVHSISSNSTNYSNTKDGGNRTELLLDNSELKIPSLKMPIETNNEENLHLRTKLNSLEKNYLELKAKYERLKILALKPESLTSMSPEETCSEDEVTKQAKKLANDENEERRMHELLRAKDTFDEWTILQHKHVLLKRYALSSMRKKMKEESIVFRPEMLSSENGPTFVIVEIKFWKPLIRKKPIEDIETEIKDFLPHREQVKVKPRNRFTSADLKSCLKNLCSFITKEYNDYQSFQEVISHREECSGYYTTFYEHLEKSMAHQQVSESLREALSAYVLDSVGTPHGFDIMQSPNKDYIDWLYCRLMDEMQSIVNHYIVDRGMSEPESFEDSSPNISSEEYFIFATEAVEENDYNRAKLLLSKIMKGDGLKDPRNWSNYAAISLKMGEYPKAVECLCEALSIDIRHKESLLMYAVLLAMAGMFDEAELFFCALIQFYPLFAEGWFITHTFYHLIEKEMSANAAMVMGTKCCNEIDLEEPYKPPQLAWDNKWILTEDSAFINTASYLLSFNLYEMAEVCLAEDLDLREGKSEAFSYYLAVCHYIQGRYNDSCHHLSNQLESGLTIPQDGRLWALFGDTKWQMGDRKEAVRLYFEAFTSERPPQNVLMACIRSGYYFLDVGKPELARQMFLRAVKKKGTPRGWLGLGISLFLLDRLDDAEQALQEANFLDSQDALTWAYLGLVCQHRGKEVISQQCFFEAKRYGLEDEALNKIVN